ncbi:MAG TPA: 16S rRNA (adenine(1518)-N(6)/adenine(1519)-N(6))-dimethyltransferase RsmA, partial [Bacteroidales bacterium]|nr:16S rRNA (adenine(1518)-N(6)/adenine(1519)-N(6))-dimethyltransferase RsmA [Bacteroidales bacterium]
LASYPQLKETLIEGDFLQMELNSVSDEKLAVIGNFPYNISSQIFFKIIDSRSQVDEVVCMIQKEVAQRIACKPGTKEYGILSVLLQAYYDTEYLFTVHENVFAPPPKVKSGVIRLIRNNTKQLDCDESLFFKVVKATFNQRRKVLSNSLKGLTPQLPKDNSLLAKRPEQLSVANFVELTRMVSSTLK